MLRRQSVLILITTFGLFTPAYAHDPEGMGRLVVTAFIVSLICTICFWVLAKKFVARKSEGKNKAIKVVWLTISILASFGVLGLLWFLLFIPIGKLSEYYETEFFLRRGFLVSLICALAFLFFSIKFLLKKTIDKRKIIVYLFLAVLFSCCIALFAYPRYTFFNKIYTSPLVIEFYDGSQVRVKREYSKFRYILIFPFGKEEKEIFRWVKNGKTFIRETWFYPIIINEFNGNLYLVEIDFGVTEYGRWDFSKLSSFKFFKYVGDSWKEIKSAEFPRTIAIQNMDSYQKDIYTIEKINPKDFNFRHSYTGILWIHLETGKFGNYNESKRRVGKLHNYDEKLFSDFIRKHMIK